MRLFLAIDLPPKIKQTLDSQLAEIKKEYADLSWVSPENYHITVYFFGYADNADKIKQKLTDALYDQSEFHLYSRDIDIFSKRKIIAYLNFRREKKLENLAEKVFSIFQIKSEEKFIPHLTLGRYRRPSKQQYLLLKKKLKRLPIDISFKVDKLILFESILEGPKPVYKKIAKINLLPHQSR